MQAEPDKASRTLELYISKLHENYQQLIKILEQQTLDISQSDEKKLSTHVSMEIEMINSITSLTKAIQIYLEQAHISESSEIKLKEIVEFRNLALQLGKQNIKELNNEVGKVKEKLQAIKLPQSARRVYYSGNNPTMMDIEI